MNKGKPEVGDIKEMLAKATEAYGETRKNFLTAEKFYELDFKGELKLPEEFKAQGIVFPLPAMSWIRQLTILTYSMPASVSINQATHPKRVMSNV
jgi:hypothetical protein